MKYNSVLKIKKFNHIFLLNKHLFLLQTNFILFKINVLDCHIKYYVKHFFSKYFYKLFYIGKRRHFIYSFKNYNFLIIQFKDNDYAKFFINFDFDYFYPEDSSLMCIAFKIKKNLLFSSFMKNFFFEENYEFIDFFIFYFYFFFFFKKIYMSKIIMYFNYIFLLNNIILCQRFIKQHLN